MTTITDALDEIITSVGRLRNSLSKSKTKQVFSQDERSVVKATVLAWFNNHRTLMKPLADDALLHLIDLQFQHLLESSDRATLRKRYLSELKSVKEDLVKLRSQVLLLINCGKLQTQTFPNPPDFSKLIPDPAMQLILNRRWAETWKCLACGAYLASTVMMGAILEALLLARINRVADKASVFTSKCTPKDRAGKTRPLQEWTLNSYIDVAHDLGWIGKPSRDIGIVLRDYRNFIHPEKELSQGVTVGEDDCRMFGAILEMLAHQIIKL